MNPMVVCGGGEGEGVSYGREGREGYDKAMLPFRAKEMALRNSVVLGTRANNVKPRNFSSMETEPRTTSTVSTRISKVINTDL